MIHSKRMECPICLQAGRPMCTVDPCSHSFCKTCINKWMNTHETCPMCRQICEMPLDLSPYYYGSDKCLYKTMKLIGVY